MRHPSHDNFQPVSALQYKKSPSTQDTPPEHAPPFGQPLYNSHNTHILPSQPSTKFPNDPSAIAQPERSQSSSIIRQSFLSSLQRQAIQFCFCSCSQSDDRILYLYQPPYQPSYCISSKLSRGPSNHKTNAASRVYTCAFSFTHFYNFIPNSRVSEFVIHYLLSIINYPFTSSCSQERIDCYEFKTKPPNWLTTTDGGLAKTARSLRRNHPDLLP